MSANKMKDQRDKVNRRRETKGDIPFGQQRVRRVKPADPDVKKGQRRVVRNPKKQEGK
jgi:hypothetical protein